MTVVVRSDCRSEPRYFKMSLAGWFRQTKPRAARKCQRYGVVHAKQMPDADKHRLRSLPCTQSDPHFGTTVNDRFEISARSPRLDMLAAQQALGAAQARSLSEQPHMTGNPESPGMRKPVSVEHEHVGLRSKLSCRR